nr:hypothetical protein [Tanacetum cinerariifolium]GEX90830.1 hypothetical protein [Tanacetum cinerariifolium]
MQEIKRLAELKAKKERSKKGIQKALSPDEIQDQAYELAPYDAKRANMLEEYNRCISFRAKYRRFVDKHHRAIKDSLSAKPQRATSDVSSKRHRQESKRLLGDILVSWDGYQLICRRNTLMVLRRVRYVMSSSTVTYIFVYTDLEPWRFQWVIDEEPKAPAEAPPSLDYVSDYVPKPKYPEYLAPSDAKTSMEDQPLRDDASPTTLSPGYVADSDPEEDPAN